MHDYLTEVEENGFSVLPELLDDSEVSTLLSAVSRVSEGLLRRKGGSVFGARNVLRSVPELDAVARSAKVLAIARRVLGNSALPVKGILFDKSADANWIVPWHQDLTICVKEKVEIDGYGPWSVKAGQVHVQPPVPILEAMLAIRIHLDDCDEQNGPLRVLPATHGLGRLSAEMIAALRAEIRPATCTVKRGGAVLMKPLLLHASSLVATTLAATSLAATSATVAQRHRRVVHVEYAAVNLPAPLCWFRDI